jgi:hypothetical protein
MRMRWAGPVTRMGEKGNLYRLLVGKPEGKRQLGRPRHRLTDNNKMDLVRFGIFTAVIMKNDVFWDVMPDASVAIYG